MSEKSRPETILADAQKDREAYFAALGLFIHRFSELEVALQYALWAKAGIDALTGRALFSGVRAREALGFVKRLFEAEENGLPPLLDRVSQRFETIMKIRNDIVHHGATLRLGGSYVSSLGRNLPGKGREFPVSAGILTQLTADIETMHACVTLWYAEDHDRKALGFATASYGEAALRAWQYKCP